MLLPKLVVATFLSLVPVCHAQVLGQTSYTNPDQVPWATLSAADVAALDPYYIMATVQPAQLNQIPGISMRGLLRRQVQSMNDVAAAGFNAAQISNLTMETSTMIYEIIPPCPFKQSFMARMQPEAFAGFQRDCVKEFMPDALLSITADAFYFFSPKALTGMNKDLIQNLNPQTGFKRAYAEQFAAFETPQYNDDDATHPCAGFTPQHIFNIAQYSIVSGFGPKCVRRFPGDVFSLAVPEQISNMKPTATAGMTSDQIARMKTNACPGLTKAILESFEKPFNMTVPEMCQGFQPACINLITEVDITGFGPKCVAQMPDNAFTQIKTIALMNMKIEAFAGFKPGHVAGLTTPAILGMSPDILRAFNASACQGFTSDQIDNLKDFVFSGFTADCLAQMTGTAFSRIKPSQFANLGGDTAKGFTAGLLKSISPNTISGLSAVFLSNLNPAACAGFSSDQLKVLSNTTCSGFTPQCIAQTAPEIWSVITSTQLSSMPSSSFAGFSPAALKNIPGSAMIALSANQVSGISISSCAALQGNQLGLIPLNSIQGISSACFEIIPSASLGVLTRGELGYLSVSVLVNMTAERARTIPTSAMSGFLASQLSNINATACSGFSALQIAGLGRNASGLGDQCVASFSSDTVSNLDVTTLSMLGAQGISGFTYIQIFGLIQRLGVSLVDSWSADQLSRIPPESAWALSFYFNSDCCSPYEFLVPGKVLGATSSNSTGSKGGLPIDSSSSWLQVMFLQDLQASGLTSSLLNAMSSRSVLGLRRGHIQSLTASALSEFDLERASYLNPESVRTLNGEQVAAIPADSIRKLYLRSLDPMAVPSITTEQARRIQATQFSSEIMPCFILGNFTQEQIDSFTPETLTAYNAARTSCSVWTAARGKPQPPQPGDQCFVTCDPSSKSVLNTGSTSSIKPNTKPSLRSDAPGRTDLGLMLITAALSLTIIPSFY